MKGNASPPTSETRWTPGAWLTLAAAVLFVVLNLAQLGYRLTIPSLGWAGPDPENLDAVTEPYFQLDFNAVGAASPLEPGDRVITIGGIKGIAAGEISYDPSNFSRPSNWGVGKTIELTVARNGRTLSLEAPLTHWTMPAWLRTNFGNFPELWHWLVTLLLFGAGAFTFIKRPGNLSARFLFAFGLANLSGTLGDSIPDYTALYFDLPAGFAKVLFSNVIFAYLIGPSFLGYALTFPKPKSWVRRQSRWLLLPYLIGSVTIVLLIVDPEKAVIGFLLTFLMLLLGVIALVHSALTMRDAISRAQLRWAVGGVIAGILVFLLNFTTNSVGLYRDLLLAVASLGLPIIGFSLAIAILRYRLYDIDIIIRKTVQYALVTGLLALVYFGLIVLLQTLFGRATGEQSPVIIVVSTLAIAALFTPLRRRVQDVIDRRFFRKKYDAQQVLARFAQTARDEVSLETLTAELQGVIRETIQPETVSLWLKSTNPTSQELKP